jgi:hypothetical protein
MKKSVKGINILIGAVCEIECFLCSKKAEVLPHQGASAITHIFCKHCGEYNITVQAELVLESMHEDIKYILSSQTFEKYYYEHESLTIMSEHILNAKDIAVSEQLYKLSRYLYYETKEKGLGAKIDGISYSQFYCKNQSVYFQLLETLKKMNIIDFKKIENPSTTGGASISIYNSPMLLGSAMLAFEEGIDSKEKFKEVFMTSKKHGDTFNFVGDKNQANFATGNANITANQYNSLDITELNSLITNIIKSLPQDISDEKRNEVTENLEFIKTEIQNSNPRKPVIKSIMTVLKATAGTAGFLASLAQLAAYLQL